MLSMSYSLSKTLHGQHFDLALLAGIAGSFDANLALASVVQVGAEYMGDLGAEDHDKFLDVFELGLGNKNEFPFKDGALVAPNFQRKDLLTLPLINGITVNTVSGSNNTIQKRAKHFKCSVESMEGAAFHYTCLMEHIPFAQVRSISNYVEPRDKSKWKIKEAITALNNWLIDFVQQ
jgi:futalosine hydrolase